MMPACRAAVRTARCNTTSLAGALPPCRKSRPRDEAETRVLENLLVLGVLCRRQDPALHEGRQRHTHKSGLSLSSPHDATHSFVAHLGQASLLQQTADPAAEVRIVPRRMPEALKELSALPIEGLR